MIAEANLLFTNIPAIAIAKARMSNPSGRSIPQNKNERIESESMAQVRKYAEILLNLVLQIIISIMKSNKVPRIINGCNNDEWTLVEK